MKKLFTFLAIAVAVAIVQPAVSHAQTDPFTVATVTTSTSTVAANTTADVTSGTLSPRGSEGLGFVAKIKLSGTGVAGVVFGFDVSVDGTTWTTTQPFTSGTITATGTTSVVHFWNFSPYDSTELRNVRYLRLTKVTNSNTPSTLTIESLKSSRYNR